MTDQPNFGWALLINGALIYAMEYIGPGNPKAFGEIVLGGQATASLLSGVARRALSSVITQAARRRRATPTMPSRPVASSATDDGSGVATTAGPTFVVMLLRPVSQSVPHWR